ncbi:MAG: 1,4-alpha-glucan branching protein GlgB [Cellulosilyticum sp.]|nr:1,4-alpha-glucan branching protein GlgB [Cellulosilyticum sp.]
MELKDFYIGKAFNAYEFFGAHLCEEGVMFRVYAPSAKGIALIGEFNDWQGESMNRQGQSGVYSLLCPEAKKGQMYKYRIYQADGGVVEHCDPYGFGMELRPNSASIIVDLNEYQFKDAAWIEKRNLNHNQPMNIYEVHLGSWRTNPDNENGWYNYSEIADKLIAYVKEEGYTHIEFLPLSEHPADCSWGYQVTGFFSPTSRYGTASQLKELVDKCHRAGIGVIMDFVPVHFAMDYYALANFDGTKLYEYPPSDVSQSEWGTCNFIHSRGEVCSFLQSSANYWLKEFHFDGLRMDAISNALYWMGDPNRGVNDCTVKFLKNMNAGLHRLNPGAMLIAEDSTSFLKVTAPVEYEGLGFDYKWDMGWMNDTLDYFRTPPEERSKHYHKLTFSMMYFYNECYLLPFSHDEVVHGKATIMQKMWGGYEDKFKQCKALYTYMYTHPGKKLNFMGNEIGQFREWDEKREQDWDLLKYPAHDSFHEYVKVLNQLYLHHPALYEDEYNRKSFRWLEVNAAAESIYIYERRQVACDSENNTAPKSLIIALNLSDHTYESFEFGVDEEITIREILNSDTDLYGGTTPQGEDLPIKAQASVIGEKPYFIDICLAPFSAKIFEVISSRTSDVLVNGGDKKEQQHRPVHIGGRIAPAKRDRARRRSR